MTFSPAGPDNQAIRAIAEQAKSQTRLFIASLAVSGASFGVALVSLYVAANTQG